MYGIESEKIKRKYEKHFNINGYVIYISSSLKTNHDTFLTENHSFCYFGNLEYGRDKSLLEVSESLYKVNKNYLLEIYSKDIDKFNGKKIPPNIVLHKQISYENVLKEMKKCFCLVIAEGTKNKNVEMTKYSLSTKVSDYLSIGKPIL